MKAPLFVATGLALMLTPLTGCRYVAGNYPPPQAGIATADTIMVVDGKRYRCFNEDGTMRCEAMHAVFAGSDNDVPAEASQRGLGISGRR